MSDIFTHLNGSDARLGPTEAEAADGSRRRVLGRLGEYTSLIVAPLNMRPRAAILTYQDPKRIEVRVSTEAEHVVVVIAPEGDLAAELFFIRALGGRRLPIPRLIAADMSCAEVPFTYIIQGYSAGSPLGRLDDPARGRVAARQIGRVLRQAHQHAAPGFGKPSPGGRWSSRSWISTLSDLLTRGGTRALAVETLGEALTEELWAATVEHPTLEWLEPRIIHGNVSPDRALVTVGSAAHLEALIRPGEIVGGDPLFDLALATLPRHAAAFQQGVYEGYTSAGTLAPAQLERLQRLRLILHVADVLAQNDEAATARLTLTVGEALGQLERIQETGYRL